MVKMGKRIRFGEHPRCKANYTGKIDSSGIALYKCPVCLANLGCGKDGKEFVYCGWGVK